MIHSFVKNDLSIVLDVNSGSVHVVDEPTQKYIEVIAKHQDLKKAKEFLVASQGEDVAVEIVAEVAQLCNKGQLFAKPYDYNPNEGSNVIKALCLHPSHDCNLSCTYCFAGGGNYQGGRENMDLKTGKKAIDFLIQSSASRENIEVDFFGGEPLLNFALVQELVSYGRREAGKNNKKMKFTLTTNAVMLNQNVIDFLNKENMSVVLSLDGRKETNDRMRKLKSGQGSYEKVKDNIERFIASRGHNEYYVRATFTRYNLDFSQDFAHFIDLGLENISIEPVVAESKEDYSLLEENIDQLKIEYNNIVDTLLSKSGKNVSFFHFNIDLTGGPCLEKRIKGCGAGSEYVAVTPGGDIYPCHQFVGKEEYKMGTVFSGIKNDMTNYFRSSNVFSKDKCSSCWAKFYCGGGCHANAILRNGNINEPDELGCELEKHRVECALYLATKKALYNQKPI